jgi:hypothetical protein
MNDLISTFFFTLIFLRFVIGVIYTLKNNSKLKKLLLNEKILYNQNRLEIVDKETLGIDFWLGNITIYENYIRIEKATLPNTYSHFIIGAKNENSKNKFAGTITLTECLLGKNNEINLKGIKYRVLNKSSINIKLKSENKFSLEKIDKLINEKFLA